MRTNKFPNSNIVYYNSELKNEKIVEYYKDAIKDGIKYATESVSSSYIEDGFLEPAIVFYKDGKLLCEVLPNDSIELFRVHDFYDNNDKIIEDIELLYEIKNVEIEYIGTLGVCDIPVFFCNIWTGKFDEDYDIAEIQIDELDTIEIGPILAYLLDCRGYNYPVWFKMLYKAGILKKTYLTSNVSTDTLFMEDNFDGGPGSGNWGHSGRPGKLGGSGKGGGKQNRIGTKETGFSSKAKASGESKGSNILSKAPKCIDDVIHYEVSKDVSKKVKSLSNKYKRNVDKMDTYIYRDKMDNDIETLFDKSTMTTKEFTDKSIQVTEKWSDEDKLLDSVYTGNDIDTIVKKGLFKEKHALSDEYMLTADEEKKYEHYAGKLNEKLYQGKELSKADIAVVEHFNRCAEPLGRDIDLYRMVGKNYLDSILEQTKVVNHEELLGKEITNKALLSTSPGINSFFWRKDVCIKIKTPKDISVCVTRSTGDGEIVIPVNSRMKVTKIEEVKNLVLPMWDSEKSNDGIVLPSGMRSNDSIGRTHTGYYMEMELIGYEN